MSATLLFVHSPLVGPYSWQAVATLATDRGRHVLVPDLRGITTTPEPRWSSYVDDAVVAAGGTERVVIVGHSGAGPFLPTIGHRLGSRAGALVFVDAAVPPTVGDHTTPARLHALLDEQTRDGRLTPWLDWWPDDVVSTLLPDPEVQRAVRADLPSVPRSLYDDPVPVPDGWAGFPCRYLRLSQAYEAERSAAAERGWPTATVPGTHLSIITDPEAVLDSIEALTADLAPEAG